MIYLIGFGLTILSTPLNGLVLSVLWGWFMVPLGVPGINIAHAIGISCVVGLLSHQPRNVSTSSPEAALGEILGWGIINPLLILLFGFIAKSFM